MARYQSKYVQSREDFFRGLFEGTKDEEWRQAILDYLEENPGSYWADPESEKKPENQATEAF